MKGFFNFHRDGAPFKTYRMETDRKGMTVGHSGTKGQKTWSVMFSDGSLSMSLTMNEEEARDLICRLQGQLPSIDQRGSSNALGGWTYPDAVQNTPKSNISRDKAGGYPGDEDREEVVHPPKLGSRDY